MKLTRNSVGKQCSTCQPRLAVPILHLRSKRYHAAHQQTTPLACVAQQSEVQASTQLPPLQQCKHFINLTNGIEAIPMLTDLGLPYSFARIQSTACEQQNFELMMLELDANFLLHLALGYQCLVYDCGSRHKDTGVPRAIWYGTEFIRYALTQIWLDKTTTAYLRGYNSARVFDQHIRGFKQSTVKRLKYYKKWMPANMNEIRLCGVCRVTEDDRDKEVHKQLLQQYCLPGAGSVKGSDFLLASQTAKQLNDKSLKPIHEGSDEPRADSANPGVQELHGQQMQMYDLQAASETHAGYNLGSNNPLCADLQTKQMLAGMSTLMNALEDVTSLGLRSIQVPAITLAPHELSRPETANHASPRLPADIAFPDLQLRNLSDRCVQQQQPTVDGLLETHTCNNVGHSATQPQHSLPASFADSTVHMHADTLTASPEAVLQTYGFSIFWRGLSPVEWQKQRQAVADAPT